MEAGGGSGRGSLWSQQSWEVPLGMSPLGGLH